MIYLLLGLIIFVFIIRKSNTDDLIKEANLTTVEQKKEFNENVLLIKSTKFSCILLTATLISIIAILLIRQTDIDLFFIKYFDNILVKEGLNLPITWYALPFFILVIRGIIVEVNIGDYIKKTYNLTEVEVDIKGEVKNLLVKKKPSTKDAPTPTIENTPDVQTTDTIPQQVTTPEAIANSIESVAPVTNEIQQ